MNQERKARGLTMSDGGNSITQKIDLIRAGLALDNPHKTDSEVLDFVIGRLSNGMVKPDLSPDEFRKNGVGGGSFRMTDPNHK
jgi:hypothetical protein